MWRMRPSAASVTCSSKSDGRTIAAAPPSSSLRMVSRSRPSGDAPATNGCAIRSPSIEDSSVMLHLGCDLLSHTPCPIDEMLRSPETRQRRGHAYRRTSQDEFLQLMY